MQLGDTRDLTTRTGKTLSARRLTVADAKALQTFNASLLPQSERWFRAHAYDDATVQKALTRSQAGDDLTLGLFDGARQVGYFFLWYFADPVPLLGVGLLDEFQGMGLGRQLLGLLIDEARATDRTGIELTTNLDNPRAFALYTNMGFTHFRDVQNLQGDGSLVVEHAMFLAIKPGAQPPNREHRPPV